MADPGRAADHAAVNTGGTGAVPHPDSAGLAYSSGQDFRDFEDFQDGPAEGGREVVDEPDADQSWGTAWSRAAALLLVCLGLAVVILVANYALSRNSSEPRTGTAAPKTTAAPSATTTVVSTPDQDNQYLDALNGKGIAFENREAGIYNGKMVCQNTARGVTIERQVEQFGTDSPKFSAHAKDFIAISIRSYCPQYTGLVAGF